MIKITVELCSARGRAYDRLLGVGLIHNVGGDEQHGRYAVRLSKMAPKEQQAWKTGTIEALTEELRDLFETDVHDFDRERRGCWDLIFIALRQLVGARNSRPEDVVPIPPAISGRRMPS